MHGIGDVSFRFWHFWRFVSSVLNHSCLLSIDLKLCRIFIKHWRTWSWRHIPCIAPCISFFLLNFLEAPHSISSSSCIIQSFCLVKIKGANTRSWGNQVRYQNLPKRRFPSHQSYLFRLFPPTPLPLFGIYCFFLILWFSFVTLWIIIDSDRRT